MSNTDSLFASIRSSLVKEGAKSAAYKEVLKLEIGKTYIVRLLEDKKNSKGTFVDNVTYSFKSNKTGSDVFYNSPASTGDRDAVAEYKRKLYSGTDADKELASKIKRKATKLVNVYVIKDETNPENEGKVKVLKLNKTLLDKVVATYDDKEDGGLRIFDLGKEGRSLKITVTKKDEFPNFDTSEFALPKAIPGFTVEKAAEIYGSLQDLTKIYKNYTFEETEKLLNEHWFNNASPVKAAVTTQAAPAAVATPSLKTDNEPEADDIDVLFKELNG